MTWGWAKGTAMDPLGLNIFRWVLHRHRLMSSMMRRSWGRGCRESADRWPSQAWESLPGHGVTTGAWLVIMVTTFLWLINDIYIYIIVIGRKI